MSRHLVNLLTDGQFIAHPYQALWYQTPSGPQRTRLVAWQPFPHFMYKPSNDNHKET